MCLLEVLTFDLRFWPTIRIQNSMGTDMSVYSLFLSIFLKSLGEFTHHSGGVLVGVPFVVFMTYFFTYIETA